MWRTEEAKIAKSTETGRREYEYAKWYAEAYAKAYTEAYAENYVKGRSEERVKVVRNFLAFGLSVEQTAEAMHLGIDEVKELLD